MIVSANICQIGQRVCQIMTSKSVKKIMCCSASVLVNPLDVVKVCPAPQKQFNCYSLQASFLQVPDYSETKHIATTCTWCQAIRLS